MVDYVGEPSVPRNLTFNKTVAKLAWEPPLNNGGVAVSYYIFVDVSKQSFSTNHTTFTWNTTSTIEQSLVEVSAVNECGLVSNTSVVINISGM
jgi:hypothetical protein